MARISTHEPVTQLRRIPIIECGEPLVDFLEMCPKLIWEKPRWKYERVHLLRLGAAQRLFRAADALPPEYRFAVIEGWRPPHIQRRMHLSAMRRWREIHPDWSELALRRMVNRYTAPMHPKAPPPHTTGGAVDLVLADESGVALDMISPFEQRDRRAYPFSAKGLSTEARKHRAILKEALESGGLTNYPSEHWHWSYGDQGWAYRGRHPHAIYGPIEPPGYVPPPEDVSDEALEWVG